MITNLEKIPLKKRKKINIIKAIIISEIFTPETPSFQTSKNKSLKFLSIDGLYKAMGYEKRNNTYPQLTDHYFTGDYPVEIVDELGENKITQLSLLSTGSNN